MRCALERPRAVRSFRGKVEAVGKTVARHEAELPGRLEVEALSALGAADEHHRKIDAVRFDGGPEEPRGVAGAQIDVISAELVHALGFGRVPNDPRDAGYDD